MPEILTAFLSLVSTQVSGAFPRARTTGTAEAFFQPPDKPVVVTGWSFSMALSYFLDETPLSTVGYLVKQSQASPQITVTNSVNIIDSVICTPATTGENDFGTTIYNPKPVTHIITLGERECLRVGQSEKIILYYTANTVPEFMMLNAVIRYYLDK